MSKLDRIITTWFSDEDIKQDFELRKLEKPQNKVIYKYTEIDFLRKHLGEPRRRRAKYEGLKNTITIDDIEDTKSQHIDKIIYYENYNKLSNEDKKLLYLVGAGYERSKIKNHYKTTIPRLLQEYQRIKSRLYEGTPKKTSYKRTDEKLLEKILFKKGERVEYQKMQNLAFGKCRKITFDSAEKL